MCLGIPMQVIRCEGERALCSEEGQEHWVDISLIGQQPPGSWLLVFLGAAREILEPLRAEQMKNALSAVAAVMAGQDADLDSLFSDLVEREPTLPPHLLSEQNNNN